MFNQLQLTLFHDGGLSTWRRPSTHRPVSVTGWSQITPDFAATACRFVEQVTLSLRPNTVKHIEHDLRRFGTWLTETYPNVSSCAELERGQIEAFSQRSSGREFVRSGVGWSRRRHPPDMGGHNG